VHHLLKGDVRRDRGGGTEPKGQAQCLSGGQDGHSEGGEVRVGLVMAKDGPALVLAEAVAEAVRVKAELDAAIDTANTVISDVEHNQ
jgi:hypothetical protein